MTVKELIEILKRMNPESVVRVRGVDSNYEVAEEVYNNGQVVYIEEG